VAVAALVTLVEGDSADAVSALLEAQSLKPDYVVFGENIADALSKFEQQVEPAADVWLWLLNSRSHPATDALAQLVTVGEKSPSATWIAPKLLRDAAKSRELADYGLTLNWAWSPVAIAEHQLDQGQHDHREELLAANRLGSLIRYDALEADGAFDSASLPLAADYELAIAMRLSGHRVVAAPLAKIDLAGASLPHSLSSHSRFEARKVQLQVFSAFAPWWQVVVLGLFAPALALCYSVWQVLRKAPERIPSALGAAFWWFVFFGVLLARRAGMERPVRGTMASLRGLFATTDEVQQARRSVVDQPAAIAEANIAVSNDAARFGGFQFWLMVAVGVASWRFWSTDVALTGGAMLPLPQSLAQVFNSAGASWQRLGFGLAAPSDPINWVWFALSAATFWAPSLAVSLLFLLAKPIAFATAFRFLSLVSRRTSVVTIGAVIYAFWPALTAAQVEGRGGTLVALLLLPLFGFALARILKFGASETRSIQTWSWVGFAGLTAAAISAGAPSLTPLVAAVIAVLAIYRFKRIGYLMWVPVPLIVLWAPMAQYLVIGAAHPLQLFQDPGVPVANRQQSLVQLLLGGYWNAPYATVGAYLTLVPLVVGLLAVLGRRALNAMWLWLALLAALASALVFNRVLFWQHSLLDGGKTEGASLGSPLALLGLAGLLAAVLLVLALEHAPRVARIGGLLVNWLVAIALGAQFVLAVPALSFSNGALLPALATAQAEQNPNTLTLVIRPQQASSATLPVSVTLVRGAGITLTDLSTAYQATLPERIGTDSRYSRLAKLAANLVAANGSNLDAGLRHFGVDYVLVPNGANAANTGAALDTVSQLDAVGSTQFGRLWQVRASKFSTRSVAWEWSITKQVQVATFALFALLAVPTRRRRRTDARDTDSHLDAFTAGSEGDEF